MCMCICCTEDKKGGVDRSSTVIAKEPEGNPIYTTIEKFDVLLDNNNTFTSILCLSLNIVITKEHSCRTTQ